ISPAQVGKVNINWGNDNNIAKKNTSEIDFNQLDISYFNYYPNEAFLEYTYFIDANSNSLSLTNIITEAVSEDIQEDIKNIPNQV
ncbi:hypothetical protein J9332_43335, partial [Aquimarina celericrescens]|nr:hypothetical protein [Aquimarina celericrescens]